MGRGRQKAKQTKVARKLKYYSPETDLEALARELSNPKSDDDPYADNYADYEDEYADEYADEYVDEYADDEDEDDWETWATKGKSRG